MIVVNPRSKNQANIIIYKMQLDHQDGGSIRSNGLDMSSRNVEMGRWSLDGNRSGTRKDVKKKLNNSGVAKRC